MRSGSFAEGDVRSCCQTFCCQGGKRDLHSNWEGPTAVSRFTRLCINVWTKSRWISVVPSKPQDTIYQKPINFNVHPKRSDIDCPFLVLLSRSKYCKKMCFHMFSQRSGKRKCSGNDQTSGEVQKLDRRKLRLILPYRWCIWMASIFRNLELGKEWEMYWTIIRCCTCVSICDIYIYLNIITCRYIYIYKYT